MKQPGQIVLFPFPYTDFLTDKLRPALLLEKLPGPYDDWLICMISSQLKHAVKDFDETLLLTDVDFSQTGLKVPSVIRIARVAVCEGSILLGTIGVLSSERLHGK